MTPRRDHHRYDWPAIVLGLLMHRDRAGRHTSATELARTVGCSRSRITQLREPGTEPIVPIGMGLLELYVERVGEPPKR